MTDYKKLILVQGWNLVSSFDLNVNLDDIKKPDGVPRKLLDSTCLNKIGWKSKIDLRVGLDKTYKDFKNLYEKYQ